MGNAASNYLCTEEQRKILPNSLKPSNPAWLIRHEEACDMPILQVQRCWKRFQQLGTNKNGALTTQSKIWSTDDKFVQQITRQFPWSEEGTLSFVVYLNMCKWFEQADLEAKVKVLFALLNRGQTVDAGIIQRVLNHVYPGQTTENLLHLSEVFIKQVDTKQQNFIDEDDFVEWMQKIPIDTISNILDFDILPRAVIQ